MNSQVLGELKNLLVKYRQKLLHHCSDFLLAWARPPMETISFLWVTSILLHPFNVRAGMLGDHDGSTYAESGLSSTNSELPSISSLDGSGDYIGRISWGEKKKERITRSTFSPSPLSILQYMSLTHTCTHTPRPHMNVSCWRTCYGFCYFGLIHILYPSSDNRTLSFKNHLLLPEHCCFCVTNHTPHPGKGQASSLALLER